MSHPDRPPSHRFSAWLGALGAMLCMWMASPVAAESGDRHARGAEAGSMDGMEAAAASRGRVLMERYHCGTCHTIAGVAAARATLAADLSDYGRRSYIAGRWPNQTGTLARWIADPAAMAPGTLMPSMGVSLGDARDMAAYLLSRPQ